MGASNPNAEKFSFVCATLYVVYSIYTCWLPGGAVVKNLPANDDMQKTWVQSLGQEDSLE